MLKRGEDNLPSFHQLKALQPYRELKHTIHFSKQGR